jgi:hypothetical protein
MTYCTKSTYNVLYWNVMWQYIQISSDALLDTMMDSIYHNLNRKLDALEKHEYHNNNNKNTTKYTFHRRLVNLTKHNIQ